jgi:chorismate mutase
MVRAIRGAICVKKNDAELIKESVHILIKEIVKINSIEAENVISVQFSVSKDLDADYPGLYVRSISEEWEYVPCICSVEMDVPGALKRCIRVLMLVNLERNIKDIKHAYLGETSSYNPFNK